MRLKAGAAAWRAVLIVAMLFALGACTVGPDYVRPQVPTPAVYAEAPGATAPEAAALRPRWWTLYGDPQLDALVDEVSVGNQSLRAAAARVREADALLQSVKGERVPAVTAGTVTRGISGRKDFGLVVSWEIDFWGRIRRQVEASRADATASTDDLAAATLSIRAQAVQAYFALRTEDAMIGSLQRQLGVDADWEGMLQNQARVGVAPASELAAAGSRVAASRTRLADARLARSQIEHALAVLVGKPPADFRLAPAPLTPDAMVPMIPADLPSELLSRRPDIVAAERRVAAASARVGVSEAERLPSLNLAGGVGVLKGLFGAVDLRAPLYRGGALDAGVARAAAEYDEAVANYRQAVLTGFQEVEDNLAAQRGLESAAASASAAVATGAESERVARNQFRAGVGDYRAVVDGVDAAVQARADALDLQRRRLDASVALIKALGGGWQAGAREGATARAQ